MELQMTDRTPEGLLRRVGAMIDPSVPLVSNLANLSRVFCDGMDGIFWSGFYLSDEKRENLYLGPYQGDLACTRIAFGKGVCGTAAATQETIIVPNVHEFPGHIACSSESNSELVVPILKNGETVAVIDLDSRNFANFTETEAKTLEQIAEMIAELF